MSNRLPCGCEETARTMGTMVRNGRYGHGHYAHDGDYFGPCEPTQPIVSAPLTDAELMALERVAKAATPGPWLTSCPPGSNDASYVTSELRAAPPFSWHEALSFETRSSRDAAHIATFDPPTVLRLLALLREREAACSSHVRKHIEDAELHLADEQQARNMQREIERLRAVLRWGASREATTVESYSVFVAASDGRWDEVPAEVLK